MRSDTPDYEILGTVKPKHSIAMSLDMTSLPELFDVLSGLYSDPEYAVVRELSTNARDSHIEAGVTRPIEITLPTELDPNLIIRDFGIGMSRVEIEDTYSKYGASTKRDSDEYNGTLGLGSKSPLTYTPQFTFVGVKNGVKTTTSVAKSDAGPIMRVMSEVPTDDHNGVTVIVPAKTYNQFGDKAEHLFRFWPEGSVLVDGEAPERVEGLNVTDDILVSNQIDQDYIVMAGVPYPCRFSHTLVRDHHLVAYVPTGNVSFVPSREALKYTTKTKEAMASILAEYEREIAGAVQDQIENAGNPREAFKALASWRTALGARAITKIDFKYNGRVIPTEFAPKNEKMTVTSPHSTKLSSSSQMSTIQIETIVEALCVYGYEFAFTASHKKKLNKYVEDNKIEGVNQYVLCKSKLPMHWLDKSRVVDWEVIRAIKLPRSGGQVRDPSRLPGSYDLCEQGDWNYGVPADDIDTTNPIYYVNITDRDKGYAYNVGRILAKHKRNFTLVQLTNNRITKFERTFPKTEDAHKELARIYKRIAKQITREERIAEMVQDDYYLKRGIQAIDLSRVDDPAFAEITNLLNYDLSGSALKKLQGFREVYVAHDPADKIDPIVNPMEKYPLVSSSTLTGYCVDEQTKDHFYLYLNAVYAASQADTSKEQ